MAKAENGVWIDKETGKVVTSMPARGRQIVPAGTEITPNVQALINRYEDNYASFEQATAPTAVDTRTGDIDEPVAKKAPAPKKPAKKDA